MVGVLFAGSLIVGCDSKGTDGSSTVDEIVAADCEVDPGASIQACIDGLPPEGGTVLVRAGTHVLTAGIHIHRSHVTVQGEMGTLIRLGDAVDEPVILVGADKEAPAEADRIENVRIADLEIDGNKANQTSETGLVRTWIRNNGIDVRMVTNLWVENVDVHDARSGGLVAAWSPTDVFVSNSIFRSNQFDGLALYDGNHMQVSGFRCHGNGASGISLDNGLNNVSFDGGFVDDNDDNGIFVRFASDLLFSNLTISGNGNFGAFLSHQATGNATGVTKVLFQGCSFFDNTHYGVALASTAADSPDNAVTGCFFSGNGDGAILDETGVLHQAANIP